MSDLAHINIVLVRPQQPGNIGVAARAIANHGIGQLTMVCPAGFAPERARWMAPKSHHVIDNARYCSTISEAVSGATQVIATTARLRSQSLPVHTPEDLGLSIAENPVPTAILFGPEDSGLSNDDLFLAESLLHFPTTEVSSINLGQAVTATAAALAMGHRSTEPRAPEEAIDRAPAARREDLIVRTLEVLSGSGYLDGRSRPIVANTLIRLAARTDLSFEEVNNLLAMIKQVDWWLKEQSK
jgi:tRNA/rRNA methyltransferase